MPTIAAVFFDIGGTLAELDAGGRLVPMDGAIALLKSMRDTLGLKVGVITNLPNGLSDGQIRHMLEDAGLLSFLDPNGLVTNHAANADKPAAEIYKFAAARLDLPAERCLYVGEDTSEVNGAVVAGMSGIVKT